jgi:zinc transport system permease protein
LGFSLLSAVGIAQIQRRALVMPDVLIGMFWPLGMALGILFISFTPGYPPSMESYLFGDILMVSGTDLLVMTSLDGIVLAPFWPFIIYCRPICLTKSSVRHEDCRSPWPKR